MVWKNNYDRNDAWFNKTSTGEIFIDNQNINSKKRNELLSKINFASPYVELPKNLQSKKI